MKLTASILIASAQAQGRNREGKDSDNSNTDAASFADSFADYFGGYDYGGSSFDYSGFDDSAFGNYNDAFGTDAPATIVATNAPTAAPTAAPTFAATEDPFAGYDFSGADDAFASYDGADDAANLDDTVADIVADVVDAAGRPDASNDDAGKSSQFIQQPEVFEVNHDNYSTWCFVGTADATFEADTNKPVADSAKTAWFNAGEWDVCTGANQVCQIKVTRKQNNIANIVSQCSNQHSCVDNMRANMNPQQSAYGTNIFFSSWRNQKCRPTFGIDQAKKYNGGDVAGSAGGRARGAVTPSECFYCVEPCRNKNAIIPRDPVVSQELQQAALGGSFCIGKSAESFGETNSQAFLGFDIFDEDTHQVAATAGAYDIVNQIDSPYLTSTLRLSKSDPNGQTIEQDLEISNIQIEQIQQIKALSDANNLPAGMQELVASNSVAIQ
jgi:hypothetical protein